MDHHAREIFRLYFAWPSADGHIPESLKRKMRLKDFRALPFGRVANRLFRRPQILGIEVPVLIQYLSVAQRNCGSRRSGYAEPHPAHHVLPDVQNGVSRRRLKHSYWLDLFDPLHRWTRWRNHLGVHRFDNADAFPLFIVVSRFAPSGFLEARVVRFTV